MAPKGNPPLNPPADKLPLAVRKNIRDDFESKKSEFEEKLSELLGQPWTISADMNLIYTNVTDPSYQSRLGSVVTWYVEPLLQNVEKFVREYGDDGKDELNSTVTSHAVEFGPQDKTDFRYGGLYVEGGVLKMVYEAPKCFATNTSDVSLKIGEALKKASESAGGKAFNVMARNNVKDNYESNVDEVQEELGTLLGVKDIKLTPNFEQNAEALSKHEKSKNEYDRNIGQATLDYFKGFIYQLKRAGFKDDDMLQEGFQEGVPNNEISLVVVDKLPKGGYNEVVLKDGTCYIHTTPEKWWVNVDSTGEKILDLL